MDPTVTSEAAEPSETGQGTGALREATVGRPPASPRPFAEPRATIGEADEFATREQDRVVRNIRAALNLGLSSCAVVLAIGLVSRDALIAWMSIAGATALTVPHGLLLVRRVEAAAMVSALIPLSLVTFYAATGSGLRDLAVAGFLVVIVYAGATLSRRGFVFFLGIIAAALGFVDLNQVFRWFPLRVQAVGSWTDLALMGTLVIVATAVAWMLGENARDGLETAHREIERRKRAEAELAALTAIDSLTGVASRRLFDEQLGLLERGRRWPVSVIVADVDGLKVVNDTFGHSTGDGLLVRAARILADGVRADDVVARIGGDEFAILLPVADEQAVLRTVERLEESLLAQPAGETRPAVSFSLGHATSRVGDIAASLKLADMRMYVRKAERKASLARRNLAQGAQLSMSWGFSAEHDSALTPAPEPAGTL